jgi:hypothetical protein
MELKRLSKGYFDGCHRIHILIDEMYEKLHDDDGNPITDPVTISNSITATMKVLRLETDFIKAMVQEYQGI